MRIAGTLAKQWAWTVVVVAWGSAPTCSAALVQWQVDSSVSYLSLQIPTQPVTIGGTPSGNAFFVNQGGSYGGTWTSGNTAPIAGTIASNYDDFNSIAFLSGQHHLVALNSGSYSPSPANWNSGTNQFVPRDAVAPASFGGQIGVTQAGLFPIVVNDATRFSIRNMEYDLSSGSLAISLGTFAATGTNLYATAGQFAAAGNSMYSVPSALEPISNATLGIGGANLAGTGTIDASDPLQPNLRRLTLPISVAVTFEFHEMQASTLSGTATGVIVAYAVVPEPGTATLTGISMLLVTMLSRRRYLQSKLPVVF